MKWPDWRKLFRVKTFDGTWETAPRKQRLKAISLLESEILAASRSNLGGWVVLVFQTERCCFPVDWLLSAKSNARDVAVKVLSNGLGAPRYVGWVSNADFVKQKTK